MRQYKNSLLSCRTCKTRWILWIIQENLKKWNQITVGDCLTFPVNLQRFQVLVPCWAATNACLLAHGIHRDYRKTFLVINFLCLIHTEIILKEFTLADHKENEDQFHKLQDRELFSQEMTHKVETPIPMPTFARRPSAMSSTIPVEFPRTSMVGQQRQQISELKFDNFPNPQSFLVWKIRFKNQATTSSDFPSESMLRIKEMEIIDSLEELKSTRSVSGKNFPKFEMLDAKIASALNKKIQNSQFKTKVSLEEQKAQKEDQFLRGRQIAFTFYDYFRVTGAHDTVLEYSDLFSVCSSWRWYSGIRCKME